MQITVFIKRGWRVREIIPLKLFLDHFHRQYLQDGLEVVNHVPWISVTWTAQAALHVLSTKTSFNGPWILICKYLEWGYRGNNISIHDKYKFTSVLSRMLLSD